MCVRARLLLSSADGPPCKCGCAHGCFLCVPPASPSPPLPFAPPLARGRRPPLSYICRVDLSRRRPPPRPASLAVTFAVLPTFPCLPPPSLGCHAGCCVPPAVQLGTPFPPPPPPPVAPVAAAPVAAGPCGCGALPVWGGMPWTYAFCTMQAFGLCSARRLCCMQAVPCWLSVSRAHMRVCIKSAALAWSLCHCMWHVWDVCELLCLCVVSCVFIGTP